MNDSQGLTHMTFLINFHIHLEDRCKLISNKDKKFDILPNLSNWFLPMLVVKIYTSVGFCTINYGAGASGHSSQLSIKTDGRQKIS